MSLSVLFISPYFLLASRFEPEMPGLESVICDTKDVNTTASSVREPATLCSCPSSSSDVCRCQRSVDPADLLVFDEVFGVLPVGVLEQWKDREVGNQLRRSNSRAMRLDAASGTGSVIPLPPVRFSSTSGVASSCEETVAARNDGSVSCATADTTNAGAVHVRSQSSAKKKEIRIL